jgi:DNA-binding transcriptional MerR regulator
MVRSIAIIGLVAVLCSGCKSGEETSSARVVGLAEFSRADATTAVADSTATESADAADHESPAPDPAGLPEGALPPGDFGDEIFPEDGLQLAEGEVIIVDSLVGQVNGRPIYAENFFEPIEDRLLSVAALAPSPRAFEREASGIIQAQLTQVILDELFLAEAESLLSPEQQMGLFALMRSLREGIIGQEGGSRAQAEQALREAEGVGVEELVQRRKEEQLLRYLFNEKIEKRAIVSWRDVEREYARRYEEFNPPATARIARIRLSTSRDAERIADVQTRLEAGEPFAQIAESLDLPQGGQWQVFELGQGGLEAIDLRDEIRDKVIELEPGETTAPFEVGRSTWWLHLESITRPPGRSVYEPQVQQMLNAQLQQRRRLEEQNRYIASLLTPKMYDDLETISLRLLEVAVQRYGP